VACRFGKFLPTIGKNKPLFLKYSNLLSIHYSRAGRMGNFSWQR